MTGTNYVSPSVEVIEIEIEDVVLAASGGTDPFSLESLYEGSSL